MSRFAIVALCVQACLIQTALSQLCGCNKISYGSSGLLELGGIEKVSICAPSCSSSVSYSAPSISVAAPSISVSAPSYSGYSQSYGASYGGSGTGQVAVSGDIGASGTTVVVGSVPVLGSIEFCGKVPASGSVSISGQCGCGCQL